MQNIESQVAEEGASLYVRYLVAAEQAVARGEFNNAKVLRALAYSHRAVAMQVLRAQGNVSSAADMLALSRLPKDELMARSTLGERLLLVIGKQGILIIEVDGLFVQRVQAVLTRDEYRQSLPPWKMHEGKAYDQRSAQEILDLLDAARARSLAVVQDLTTQQWADASSMLGGRRSVLELGTWHANHDVGHVAQIRRLLVA